MNILSKISSNTFLRRLSVSVGLLAGGVLLSYYWRVFFYLDNRFSPLFTTLFCVGLVFAVGGIVRLAVLKKFSFELRGTLCIFLCGMLFAFANPPLQTPDETDHYLRTYAISEGHFDFDADRTYPDDVAQLMAAFPGAWVNAHTSAGIGTDPDTGEDTPYNTAGYALKQYGKDGEILSIWDSFTAYLHDTAETQTVTEPISFLIIPFLPGAFGMMLARMLGFGALGCLYGGRLFNLLAYTLLCGLALREVQRFRPALLCVMLLPMSLYMGASLSYDATLLGCYYLMLSLLTKRDWDTHTAAIYAAACVFSNIAKPYLNLLWAFLPLLVVGRMFWQAKGRLAFWTAGMLGGSLGVTLFVEWYGTALRFHYDAIARQGGSTVNGGQQLVFILSNPLRFIAVLMGTLYENDFFIGQLGLFGWKDLPIAFLSLTGCLVLAAGLLFAAAEPAGLGKRRRCGLGLFGLVYGVGAMTAMYITYTPVAMVRVVGLQTRYFLPLFLVLVLIFAGTVRKVLRPALAPQRAESIALPLFACYGAVGAVLLLQHYFVGPFYTIPMK